VIWEQEDASVAPFLDSVFRKFESLPENKGLKIKRVHYGNEDLRGQFQTSSIAGTPPDLVLSPPDPAGVYSVSGFLLAVDKHFDLSIYEKNAVGAISHMGKTWGVPTSMGNHLMFFFNKNLIKTAPESTGDMFQVCDKLISAKKISYCLSFDMGEPFWLVPWLGSFGGWPINDIAPTLNSRAMQSTLNFYRTLLDKNFVPQECDYNCADALFKEEKIPFLINGDWAISVYSDYFKNKLGIAKIPKNSITNIWPTPMISGKYFMLSAKLNGEKLENVKKLILFFTNFENQVNQLKSLNRLPSLIAASKIDFINNDPLLRASLSQVLVGKPMPMAMEMRAIWDAIRPQLRKIIIDSADANTAAALMQKDATKKISEMQ